jgi:hypothetical protein
MRAAGTITSPKEHLSVELRKKLLPVTVIEVPPADEP